MSNHSIGPSYWAENYEEIGRVERPSVHRGRCGLVKHDRPTSSAVAIASSLHGTSEHSSSSVHLRGRTDITLGVTLFLMYYKNTSAFNPPFPAGPRMPYWQFQSHLLAGTFIVLLFQKTHFVCYDSLRRHQCRDRLPSA